MADEATAASATPNSQQADATPVSAWQTLLDAPENENVHKFKNIRNAANARQKDVQKRMEKTLNTGHRVEEAMRARKKYTEVRNIISHSKVVTKVERGTEDINISYRDQGNVEMYNETNTRNREANKHHPAIKQAIENFWNSIPKMSNGQLSKSIYIWFCRKLFFALVPNASEDEFQLVVQEDWKNDALWSHYMNSRMFHAAIFSTADTWCETTDPQEYADFISKLQTIVARGQPFKGNLDVGAEDEAAGKRKKNFLDQRRRRASQFAAHLEEGDDNDEPHDIADMLKEEERLDDEQFEDESTAWMDIVMQFFATAEAEATSDEEALLLLYEAMGAKRAKLLGDNMECSALTTGGKEEREFIDTMKDAAEERAQIRERLSNEMKKFAIAARKAARGRSHRERMANRAAFHTEHMERQDLELGVARDILYNANITNRQCRDHLWSEEVKRLNLKAELDPYESEHNEYLRHKATHIDRRADISEDLHDDVFAEFVMVTKNIRDARELLRALFNDPLFIQVLGMDDDLQIDSPLYPDQQSDASFAVNTPMWQQVVGWFHRYRTRRNDFLDEVLENVEDTINRIKGRENRHIKRLHEQWIKMEQARLRAIEGDEAVTAADKADRLAELKKSFELAKEQRENQLESIRTDHYDLDALCEDFSERASWRKQVEAGLKEAWTSAKSFKEAVQAAAPLWEIISSERIESSMTKSKFIKDDRLSVDVSRGGTLHLPEEIANETDFVYFLAREEERWLGSRLETLAASRHRAIQQAAHRIRSLEAEMDIYIAQWKLSIRQARVLDLPKYEANLAKPKCPLSIMGKQIAKDRLKKTAQYKEECEKTVKWLNETTGNVEGLLEIRRAAAEQRRSRFQSIFTLERMHRERWIDMEAGRARHYEYKSLFDQGQVHAAEREVEGGCKSAEDEERARSHNEQQERVARRAKEAEERRAAEAAKKAAERDRIEELERRKKESLEKQRLHALQEKRKKALEDQVARQKAREKKEQEEKERWRKKFLEEEKKREKEEAARRTWTEAQRAKKPEAKKAKPPRRSSHPKVHRRTSKTAFQETSTPPSNPLQPSPPKSSTPNAFATESSANLGGSMGGQKSGVYTSVDGSTSLGQRALKRTQSTITPARLVKISIEEGVTSGTIVASPVGKQQDTFANRRQEYLTGRMSNKDIYRSCCKKLGVPPDVEFLYSLNEEPLEFNMSMVSIANRAVNIKALLDVILMNPVQHLYLRKANLTDADFAQICENLKEHHFISHIDVKGSKAVTNAKPMKSLLDANRYLVKAELSGTSVPDADKEQINAMCERNAFARTVGRAEFKYIEDLFNSMDKDGSGDLSLDELKGYADREKLSQSQQAQKRRVSLDVSAPTVERIEAKIAQRVANVKQQLINMNHSGGDGSMRLEDLICFIFPQWTKADALELIAKYQQQDEEEGGPSTVEMQEFIDTFGTNGNLSLEQLARGLGESPDALRTVFLEYDIDNDGRLSLEEFVRFMSA